MEEKKGKGKYDVTKKKKWKSIYVCFSLSLFIIY